MDDGRGRAGDPGQGLKDEERKEMLKSLHRSLVWIGVRVPDRIMDAKAAIRAGTETCDSTPPEVHQDKGDIDLRHLIERLINEKELTPDERCQVREMIDILRKREVQDEEKLGTSILTRAQARELYDETAGVLRALVELKDLLKGREHGDEMDEAVRRKVEDARRWNAFMKQIKE